MNTLRQTWISLTAPLAKGEKEARREHMTRVIYLMVSAGLLLMSIIVPIYDFSVGEPDYTGTILMLLTDSLMFTGWLFIYRGGWYISRYLLPAIFLALGGYFFYNVGLITTGVLQLAIAIILTALLFGSKAQWVAVVFSVILYLTLGWLAGERDFEVFFTGGIVVGFSLGGIALLQWFSSTLLKASIERLRKVETESRESAEKVRAIFESIHDGITITDMQGTITDLNQAVLKLHGFENRDELIGQAAFLLIAERDHSTAMENLQLTLTHETSGLLEYTFLKKNGEEFDGELHAVLIKDEAGNPAGFVALTRDITNRKKAEAERKQAEQALNLSEEKFSKAFNTTPVLMTIEDNKHIIVDVNKAFLDAFGLEREEVVGNRVPGLNILYEPDDLIALRKEYQENGVLKDFEIRMRRKTGEVGVVLLSSDNFYMDGIEHTLTSGLDITERKHAEEKYRSIYNNSIEGIFQSTEDGHFLSVNPAMSRIYGYDSPEDMLYNVNDIGDQLYVDSEQRKEVRQRLSGGERLAGYESLEYRKDGSTFWSSMSAQAIRDENGKVLYYEGSMEDITPRKHAEAEREKLIAELQSKNEELERFTYTVSHDLKAPLITIGGFLGYLEDDILDGNSERVKQDVERINGAVKKMNQLLNELLELSRIGRMTNPPEDVPFEEIVREALEKVQGQLSSSKVKVKVEKGLPIVNGDRIRLVEVIQNLLDNAVKFMGDQPKPKIEVGVRQAEGESIFFVKDNGIGIGSEYHEKIFGLFDKLDPNIGGTGIGLALVKRIIEVHNGRAWVESEPGNGATFCFTLPLQLESKR
jgi:PAS domain S-box-containing protein